MVYSRHTRFRLRYNKVYWLIHNFRFIRHFSLSLLIIILDQITKILIIKHVPLYTISLKIWGDFFQIIHVRNLGMSFSIGAGLPIFPKIIMLILIPLFVLVCIAVYSVHNRELTQGQRWLLAGLIGGGLGNQWDRIFRSGGVVDFLDFKFYGLLGMERWPTFNFADFCIVVSTLLLLVSMLSYELKARKH